jgi:nucleoside-diphosphate-sugar epimerase
VADHGWSACLFDLKPPSLLARFILDEQADRLPLEIGGVDDWSRLVEVVKHRRPRYIVHMAVIQAGFTKDIHLNVTVNVMGTINVLEVARLFDVERVVFFSTVLVVPRVQYEPVDTAHPIILPREGPHGGFYGASKLAGEAFCFAYQENFGIDVRIIRPTSVYGHGMSWETYIKLMVEGAVRGESVSFDHGGPFAMDYVHVEDVAGLAVALLEAPEDADRVFYATTGGPPVTTAELARIVMGQVPGARITVGDQLSEEDKAGLPFVGRMSIDSAREQFGWVPTYASIHDGVARYIDRYRTYLEVAP